MGQPDQKIPLLQVGRLTTAGETQLRQHFAVTSLWEHTDREALLARKGDAFRAVVTAGSVPVPAELIAALPALQVIGTRGVGYDHVDWQAAQSRGIAVGNTPGVLTDCIADLAFGALIALARRLAPADRFARLGEWIEARFPLTTRVSGKRLGILGMGRIGQAVARRASGFAMTVRYHSRHPLPQCEAGYAISPLDLAAWADFLVVCVPGGNATYHLITAAVLDALGPEGFLINVARGSVVDEDALVRALTQGKIAGAALDVYQREPNVSPALIGLDNTLLLPHIASSTRETFSAMEDLLFANLRSFFTTGQLLTPVP